MAFCRGKKAVNSYEGFIAIVLILSEFLRSGLLTSRKFDEIIILKIEKNIFWFFAVWRSATAKKRQIPMQVSLP